MITSMTASSSILVTFLACCWNFRAVDAAAGYPLMRDAMEFLPLSCNSLLDDPGLDCSTSLESIVASTAPGANVVVPCGTCATLTTSDGSVLTLDAALDVQGKLLVPATAQATLRTTAIFVQGKLQIDPPLNLDGLKVSLYGTDSVLFIPHADNLSKCAVAGCNVSSKAVVAAGGQFDIRGDQLAAEGSTCKTWTTIQDALTTHPIFPNDPVCRTDGSPLEIGAEGTFETGTTQGFSRYRAGSISLAADDLILGNTYLHNTGRNNVKDGIYILGGNHTTCLMRNRLYELKFKYRLFDNLEGEHRPNVRIHVGDRDNPNQKDIAYESLDPVVAGVWTSATIRFDSNDIPDAGGFDIIVNWPTTANATAGYDDISLLPVINNLPTDSVCRTDGSPMEIGADGTFENGSQQGFSRYRWGEIEIVEDDLEPGNKYLRNTGRGNAKDGLTILSGDHQTCLLRDSLYEMSIKYRLDLDGEHRPQIRIHVNDRKNDNQRVIAYESLPPSINGAWATASFSFDSRDVADLDHFSILVNWPTSANATAGYDDISILPIDTHPPGKADTLFVDSATAACWAPKVGTTLLVTSNEIGTIKEGWDAEDLATIESIDVTTGAIKLTFPLNHYKTTAAQDPRFATEVAILHRATVFEAENDNVLDYIGGHSMVMHTAAEQRISGAAFYNFGQQGLLGKYPVHFHMAGNHSSSVVSKNVVQRSNQRCYVIHGTDGVQVLDNIAYDTIGHCYINENGVEEDIQFIRNLGALSLKQPEERRIGNPLVSDHRAYTFWFSNANVRVEDNVAAGAPLGGYWYETFEGGPQGEYADWPEYADFNPKTRPLGSFIGNVVHSSGERGIRMYEPGYKPDEEFTFYNTRVYKNNQIGVFIHGVQNMVMDGGVFADNMVNIRNFNARTVFRNLELIGTTDLVRERNPTLCHNKNGLQQRINAGWNEGAIVENVTFSGINKEYQCNETGVRFYHLTNKKWFEGNVYFSDIEMEPGMNRTDFFSMECRWMEDPYLMKNVIVEDYDGTIGLTGNPGFYVMDDPTILSWIPGATCVQDIECGLYCDNVCLRNVNVKTPGCSDTDPCYNYIMVISNGVDSFSYERHVEQSDEKKSQYEAVLPQGNYDISFYTQEGAFVENLSPTDDVTIVFGDEPRCNSFVVETDIALAAAAPTAAPTAAQTASPTAAPTPAPVTSGAQSDPIILGLNNQVFKFEGRNNAWYANLANKYLLWNMQFRQFDTCPVDQNMYVTGISISTFGDSDSKILIATTPDPIEECRTDPDATCLGGGTLHVSFDGGATFNSQPGDYHSGSRTRVVAHNTYAACSRKWHDYDVSQTNNMHGLRNNVRRLEEKKPLQLLADKKMTMIDPIECNTWIEDRFKNNDLFQQKGQWSTIYLETEMVSFHIEYRRSDFFKPKCDFQSLDAWMTKVDVKMEHLEWNGILGETKNKIYDEMTGEQVLSDRMKLLRGKDDANYEVEGPFGKRFAAENAVVVTATS